MKIDFSKLDYKMLVPYVFLFGMALNAVVSMITFFVYGEFWFLFLLAAVILALEFYRFNNGITALIFGEFGVSMTKKYKNVIKHNLTPQKTEELLSAIKYGEKSIVVHRKNTHSYYQIVKRENSFYIKKCSYVSQKNLITDFDIKKSYKGNKNIELMFKAIKEIWYTVDVDNEKVIYISNGKRKFPMVPEFPIDNLIIEEFLSFDGNKDSLFKETPKEEFEKARNEKKSIFFANILSAIGVVFMVQSIYAAVPQNNLWPILCSVILLACMWAFVLLSFFKPEKFFYYLLFKEGNVKEGFEIRQLVMYLVPVIILLTPTILNWAEFLKISLIIFAVAFLVLFPRLIMKKRKNSKSANLHILVTCIILAVTCVMTTFFVNNLHIKSESTITYSVNGYGMSGSRYGDDYFAWITVDGKEQAVDVDYETYEKKNSGIEVCRIKGLLGIEYLINV